MKIKLKNGPERKLRKERGENHLRGNVTNTSNSYYPLVTGVALCIAGFKDN